MEEVYTTGIVPYTTNGYICLQKRSIENKKNGEDYAFFGGRRDIVNGKLETTEEAFFREAQEELPHLILSNYQNIGSVQKSQTNRVCFQETYMVPVSDITKLIDYEGLGVEAFTISQARKLKMNPGDHLVLDLIEDFLTN